MYDTCLLVINLCLPVACAAACLTKILVLTLPVCLSHAFCLPFTILLPYWTDHWYQHRSIWLMTLARASRWILLFPTGLSGLPGAPANPISIIDCCVQWNFQCEVQTGFAKLTIWNILTIMASIGKHSNTERPGRPREMPSEWWQKFFPWWSKTSPQHPVKSKPHLTRLVSKTSTWGVLGNVNKADLQQRNTVYTALLSA